LKQQLKWKRIWQRICERMVIPSPVVHRGITASRSGLRRAARSTRRALKSELAHIRCFLCMHSFSGESTE
jgi:hypothetical protein